jgi:hypothetical protein
MQGTVLHVGMACAQCQQEIVAMIQQQWPDVPVSEEEL